MEPLARRTGAQNMDGLYREKAIDRQLGSGSGADGLEIVTRTVVDARITINFRRTASHHFSPSMLVEETEDGKGCSYYRYDRRPCSPYFIYLLYIYIY